MNKRVFSVVLALVLALATMSCAFASPASISTGDVVKATVTEMKSSTGAVLPSDFSVAPVATTAKTQAAIDNIAKAATSGDLASFFGSNAVAAIAQISASVNVANLKLDEAFPISVANYAGAYGDVTVTLRLTKDYKDGDVIVALVGIINADGTITWVPVEATVVNGEVAVTFTEDVLTAGADGDLVFALLSE